jgi:hypothetical protein
MNDKVHEQSTWTQFEDPGLNTPLIRGYNDGQIIKL